MDTPLPNPVEGARQPASPPAQPMQYRLFKQVFKAVRLVLYGLVAIIFIATGILWWWAGTDDSLAQAVRLGQTCCGQPLQTLTIEQARGALRSGGSLGRVRWQQDGLTVEARGVKLAWQPWALLNGTLQLDHLTVDSLQIADLRTAPASAPPDALGLPLRVTLATFSIGALQWQGPTAGTAFSASDIAGRYAFDGLQHAFNLTNAQIASGSYSGSATLAARSPLRLKADVKGTVTVTVPMAQNASKKQAPPPATISLAFEAAAAGPLHALQVNAALRLATRTDQPTQPQPRATLTATLTPWAAQAVAGLDADFQDLDIAAFWADAPRTLLTGHARARPLESTPASTPTARAGDLQAQLQLTNRLAGPLDQQRLPLEKLDATGQWRQGMGIVRTLKALGAGGELVASGEWADSAAVASDAASNNGAVKTPPAAQGWKLQATLKNINSAQVHSQLAALPLNGQAAVRSLGAAIGFDASLAASRASLPSEKIPVGRPANLLSQLRLQSASATGSWRSTPAGATLVLSALKVQSDDAELNGQLEAELDTHYAARGGQGTLLLTAPGVDAKLAGELRQASGAGNLSINGRDTVKALRWLQKIPGLPAALQNATATGSAELTARWQGGWQDPTLQAKLALPALDWRTAASVAATTTTTTTTTATATATATATLPIPSTTTATPTSAPVLKFRAVQATLSGRLRQAQLSAEGRLESGEQRYTLQLAADAGRTEASVQKTMQSAPGWQGVLKQLKLSAADPALGNGAWQLATRGPVAFNWTPSTPAGLASSTAGQVKTGAAGGFAGGTFETSAGEAVLVAPSITVSSPSAPPVTSPLTSSVTPPVTASAATAVLSWQPVRWRPGEFSSAGKLTGLPMAWLSLLAGPQMASLGLSGNLVFDADWDARLTDTLRLKASLARSSGDITLQAEAAQVGAARIAAGVKQARLSLESAGNDVTLALRWDSERAGSAEGQLKTSLTRATSAAPSSESDMALGGWVWPANAPLAGQLRAQLPRIGVWSALAPPGWRIRGSLGANIAIQGTRAAPQLTGELQANDLALRSVVDGIEFGNGRLRAQLDGTRMVIHEFTLQGAGLKDTGGTLTAGGEALWKDGQPRVALSARLERLRASIRTDRQITLSGDLQAKLEGKLTQFSGQLKVDQARIVLPEESTPALGDDVIVRSPAGSARGALPESKTAATQAAPAKESRHTLKLNVALDMGQDFRVQGKGMDTLVRGTLALSGTSLTEPRLVGSVSTFGGEYRAYGQRLDVEQGLLRFTGAIDNPSLDILAIRPNLSQRVGVQILGTALLPRVRLYAEPELPDAEKLSWLVLGRPSSTGGGEAALLQQAALALFGNKAGGMSGGLAASLGLDDLSFRGASSNADGSTSQSAVTLGKRFSRNFYASYERTISGALGTLYIFYDLSQRFTVRAQAGQQSAVDLIFTLPYD